MNNPTEKTRPNQFWSLTLAAALLAGGLALTPADGWAGCDDRDCQETPLGEDDVSGKGVESSLLLKNEEAPDGAVPTAARGFAATPASEEADEEESSDIEKGVNPPVQPPVPMAQDGGTGTGNPAFPPPFAPKGCDSRDC